MKQLSTLIIFVFAVIFTVPVSVSAQNINVEIEQNENEIRLYPNPANDRVQIVIENSTLESPAITIHSIIGNKMNVTIESVETNKYRADISALPSGYYLIVIKEKDFNKAYKFLKQ